MPPFRLEPKRAILSSYKANQTTMPVTLTVNYRDTLAPETLTKIDAFTEDNYDLEAILEFIDERSELDFREYYEDYVEAGENFGYATIDAFLTLRDLDELDEFKDYFIGEYNSPEQMAEEFLDCELDRLPFAIVVDWSATAQYLLDDCIEKVDDFYFRSYR